MIEVKPVAVNSSVSIRRGYELVHQDDLEVESRWRNGFLIQNSAGLIHAAGGGGDGSIFGWDPSELVSRTAPHLIHPDDRELAADVRNAVAERRENQFVQVRVRSKKVRWVWAEIEVRYHPSVDTYPIPMTVSFIRDVSAAYLDHDVLGLVTEMRSLVAASSSLSSAWRAALKRFVTIGGFVGGFVWERRDDEFWVGPGWSPSIDDDVLAAATEAATFERLDAAGAAELFARAPTAWSWTSDETMQVLGRGDEGRYSSLMIPVERSQSDLVAVIELVSDRGGCENEELVTGVARQLGDTIQQKDVETRLTTAEQEFRAAFTNAPVGIALYRPDGSFEHVNPALCEFLGRPETELARLTFTDVTHAEFRNEHLQAFAEMNVGIRDRYDAEKKYLRPDGRAVWGFVSVSPVRSDDGDLIRFISQIQDIDDRKQAEREVQASRARMHATFDDSGIAMALVRLDGDVLGQVMEANQAFLRLTGLDADDIENHGIVDLIVHSESEQFGRELESLSTLSGEPYRCEARVAGDADTDERWVRIVAAPVRDPGIGGSYAVVHLEDVTEQRIAQQDLARTALHDSLTDLPNRALIIDRISNAQTRSERSGHHIGLLFLDLDKFKDVNDSLGHQAGDELLKGIADRLRATIRPSDTAARLGGDEFVILCDELSVGVEDARRELESVADRIHASLDDPFFLDGVDAFCTASIGMHVLVGAEMSVEAALGHADAAMYRAKARGRARSEAYTAATKGAGTDRLRLASELRQAIGRNQLHVAYQPIVSVEGSAVVGAEALLRWTHPQLGVVPPDQFIAVAEDSDLIVLIGDFVLGQVCHDMTAHRAFDDLYVSVNVSARQLSRSNFVETYRQHLVANRLPASRVALELTENVLMDAAGSSLDQLETLRDLGASIGVDDFGTGYASLTYLKQLPIDFVKIDRSFVDGLPGDQDDHTITSAVIGLAGGLGLRVIAEGVETDEQSKVLAELGCGFAQGYYFGRPVPVESDALLGSVEAS